MSPENENEFAAELQQDLDAENAIVPATETPDLEMMPEEEIAKQLENEPHVY